MPKTSSSFPPAFVCKPPSWRRLFYASLALSAAAALAGCLASAPIIGTDKPPSEWPVVPMESASVMPDPSMMTRERLNRRTRVVVMQPAEIATARGWGLEEVARTSLEALLAAGQIEVVDRRLAGRLENELKLCDMKGCSQPYRGPEVAEFALLVEMGATNSSTQYEEALKIRKATLSPAGHVGKGESNMIIKIYELPTLRLVNSVNVKGSARTMPQPTPPNQAQLLTAVRKATQDAIESGKVGVLSELIPRGYISERRALEKRSIFRALISRNMGAVKGDKVEIVSLSVSEDPLTKRRMTDRHMVATGFVSEVQSDEASWIIVDDQQQAARIRRGDIVKVVKNQRTLLEKVTEPLSKL